MRKNSYLLKKILLLWTAMSLCTSVAYAKPLITWYIVNWPPVYITEGADKGKGLADVQLQVLIDNMPEYDHEIRVANYPRIKHEILNSPELIATCQAAQADPVTRFGKSLPVSEPILFYPPTGFVIRKADKEKFTYENSTLKLLFENSQIRAGIPEGASFAADPYVKSLMEANRKNIVMINDPDQKNIFKMLLATPVRFDYFFTHATTCQYFAKMLNMEDKILFRKIKEKEEYMNVYIFFSEHPEAKPLIHKINQIAKTNEYKEKAVGALLQYLPENLREEAAKKNGLR